MKYPVAMNGNCGNPKKFYKTIMFSGVWFILAMSSFFTFFLDHFFGHLYIFSECLQQKAENRVQSTVQSRLFLKTYYMYNVTMPMYLL